MRMCAHVCGIWLKPPFSWIMMGKRESEEINSYESVAGGISTSHLFHSLSVGPHRSSLSPGLLLKRSDTLPGLRHAPARLTPSLSVTVDGAINKVVNVDGSPRPCRPATLSRDPRSWAAAAGLEALGLNLHPVRGAARSSQILCWEMDVKISSTPSACFISHFLTIGLCFECC